MDHAPFPTLPSRRDGRPTPPPAEGRYFSLTLERPPLASAETLRFESNCARALGLFSSRNKPRSKIARVAATPRGASYIHCVHSLFRWRQLVFQKTISVRAPGEIISDKLIVYRLDFLLRRGARCRSALEPGLPVANFFDCPQAGQAPLTQRRRAHRAFYWPSGQEKRALAARLGNQADKLIVYRSDFLLRRGARGFSLHFATQTQQKPLWGRVLAASGRCCASLGPPGEKNGQRKPRQNTQRVRAAPRQPKKTPSLPYPTIMETI